MKKLILITGVAGFIGSKIADRFIEEGFHVVGVDDLSNGKLISLNPECSHSSSPATDNRYRAYDPNGIFVGIVRNDKISGNFHPEKIFNLDTDLITNSLD